MDDTKSLAILDFINHPVVLIDNGIVVYANASFSALLPPPFLHRPFIDLIVPKHKKRVAQYFHSILGDHQTNTEQSQITCAIGATSGEEISLKLQGKRFCFQNKEMTLCSLVDITALQKAYTKFPRILNAMSEAIFTFSADHKRILSATNGCEGIYGLPLDQFTSNVFHPIDLVVPEDTGRAKQFYSNLLVNEFDSIEYRIVHTNGDIVWIHDEGEVIYKEKGLGEVHIVYHFIRNVTERKLKDERLQLSEERYRRIFERSTNPIFIVTLQGNFLDMNEAAITLFGFESREEAFHGNVQNLFFKQGQLEEIIAIIKEKGSITDEPMQMLSKTGKLIDVVLTAGGRKNSKSGRLERFQVILHDPRAVIRRTELETYRRTLGGISDRINNIAQAQMMQQGLIRDYLFDLPLQGEKEQKIQAGIERALVVNEKTSKDLATLGETVRQLYHNPKPPKPVSDGAGGILFDLSAS